MDLLEQLEFLKNLQKELLGQDHDSQEAPRFWTIMSYKDESCWEEIAEGWEIYSPESANTISTDNEESFREDIENYDLGEEAVEAFNFEDMDDDDLLRWYQKYIDEYAYLVPIRREGRVMPSTFFLSKEEAKTHLKVNHYHYSHDAHTYAMTAWRAPKTEKVFEFLETADFEKLISLLKAEEKG